MSENDNVNNKKCEFVTVNLENYQETPSTAAFQLPASLASVTALQTDVSPHCKTVEQVAEQFQTDLIQGLTTHDAAHRLKTYGPNQLDTKSGVKVWQILLRHIFSFMNIVLLVAMVIAFSVKQWLDGGVVAFIIVVNILIGFVQEYRSERSLEALKKMQSLTSRVIRDGAVSEIPSNHVTVGDIVLLEEGDQVPADCRLTYVALLECQESMLTGESLPVKKDSSKVFPTSLPRKTFDMERQSRLSSISEAFSRRFSLASKRTIVGTDTPNVVPIGDRSNMVFSGTVVVRGKGRGIVIATGMNTEIGSIAKSLKSSKKNKSKIQKRMNLLGIVLVVFGVFCTGLIILGVYLHGSMPVFPDGLQAGVSTAVAIVPEGLMPVLTLTLTMGIMRMAKERAIVRKLDAVESLGNITDICSDKTGTLTEGVMTATSCYLSYGETIDVVHRRKDSKEEEHELVEMDNSKWKNIEDTFELITTSGSQGLNPLPGNVLTKDSVRSNPVLRTYLEVCSLCNSATITKVERNIPDTLSQPRRKNKVQMFFSKKRKDEDIKVSTEEDEVITGDPTEVALLMLSHRLSFGKSDIVSLYSNSGVQFNMISEYPFDSDIKRMSVLYQKVVDQEELELIYTKGAPERILNICTSAYSSSSGDGDVQPLTEVRIQTIKGEAEHMAQKGLRILAFAFKKRRKEEKHVEDKLIIEEEIITEEYKSTTPSYERSEVEKDLTFVGLIGLQDPPRQGVVESIRICHEAGIVVRMITGDHKSTALSIAKQCGIISNDGGIPRELIDSQSSRHHLVIDLENQMNTIVMNAQEFDSMTDEELTKIPELPLVIARCTPNSKERLIHILHKRSKYCAVTGDGVNDSACIKAADVGIAMGKTGSDVTKEVADIVLTDDDFSTIVVAIKQGRHMFESIRKFLIHLLSGNVSETVILVVGVLSGLKIPLNSTQILWMNLVTGTGPALGLGTERVRRGIMTSYTSGLFTFETIFDMFFYGIIMGMLSLGNFLISSLGFHKTHVQSQSLTFMTATLLLLLHAYNCRHMRRSFFLDAFYKSYPLHAAVIFAFVATVCTLYIPWISDTVFHQNGLDLWDWILVIVAGELFMVISEIYKACKRVGSILWWKIFSGFNYEFNRKSVRSN